MYVFHFMKCVTKNIDLFHDILICLDVPVLSHWVCVCVWGGVGLGLGLAEYI